MISNGPSMPYAAVKEQPYSFLFIFGHILKTPP